MRSWKTGKQSQVLEHTVEGGEAISIKWSKKASLRREHGTETHDWKESSIWKDYLRGGSKCKVLRWECGGGRFEEQGGQEGHGEADMAKARPFRLLETTGGLLELF